MKGIILAGGTGSRLFPITNGISKQLIPIYDKPLIYYPLSVLMLSGIKEILIISNPQHLNAFKDTLGDGSSYGISISYQKQNEPRGLADAFIIGEKFIDNDNVALVLGDNIFWGHGFTKILNSISEAKPGATVFGYKVTNPSQFGVVEFDKNNKVISVEEKPINPKSNFAITGLYFFDNKVVDYAKSVIPSERGELEITSILDKYLQENSLNVELLGRGFTWFDTGTKDSLFESAMFIKTMQNNQGFRIGCLEEIAWKQNWINDDQLIKNAELLSKTGYGKYLLSLLERK
jgi:glucose-1-phosphate thymidylyltransferase|tara:strand:+ start:2438 stop:3307 length:870 start_codon:yes stop_codon:yes gene_type:complete